jgi:hypothetical protein
MGLKEWWEGRQQRKHEEQNAKLLDLAEHPQGQAETGTDIDDLKTDLGNSRLGVGGEMSGEEVRKIE